MALDSQIAAADRPLTPPTYWSYDIAGSKVEHIRDATPEEWRRFGIGVCDYAITHGLTRDQLIADLILLGVLDDPEPAILRDQFGNPRPARGRCPECRRGQAVALDGRLYKHRARSGDGDCDGSYGTPEQVAS